MGINYTILKSSIINSSLWVAEDSDTRCVWITLLAMRNKDGEIYSSIPGIAHAACVEIEKTRQAIIKFLSPDIDSTTKDNEGRRLAEIQGGWKLINHERVKAEAAAASKAAYMQDYMKQYRKHQKIAKSLGTGEKEYLQGVKDGLPPEQLDAIVTKYLPQPIEAQ